MPPYKRTNMYKAAEAMELVKEGKSTYKAAALTNLPQRTVHDIIAGKHGWKAIHNDPLFVEHRLQIKRSQQLAMNELVGKALVQVDATIDKASAYQAAGIAGLLFDKERLLAGEASHNIEVHTKGEVVASEATLAALMASMGIDASKAMGYVAQPVESGHATSNGEDATSNTSDARHATHDALTDAL